MTAVDDFQTEADRLATDTAAQVLAVYAAARAGQITTPEAPPLLAGVVNLANAAAVTLADAYVSLQIEEATGLATPTIGIVPRDDSGRLTDAATTILTDTTREDRAALRLERLAVAEPLDTAQTAATEAIQAQPLVRGWARQMDADPCQLCRWWWREGRIWPAKHPMPRHKGCRCVPRIVLVEHIQPTRFTRRLERNAR